MSNTLAEFKRSLSSLKQRDLKEIEDLLVSLRSDKADGDLNGFGAACKDVFGNQCPPAHALVSLVGPRKLKANVESLSKYLQGLSPDQKFTRIEMGYLYRVILKILREYLKKQGVTGEGLGEVISVLKELDRYEEAIQDAYPGYRGTMLRMVLKSFGTRDGDGSEESSICIEPLSLCKCGNNPTHKLMSPLGEVIDYRCSNCLNEAG